VHVCLYVRCVFYFNVLCTWLDGCMHTFYICVFSWRTCTSKVLYKESCNRAHVSRSKVGKHMMKAWLWFRRRQLETLQFSMYKALKCSVHVFVCFRCVCIHERISIFFSTAKLYWWVPCLIGWIRKEGRGKWRLRGGSKRGEFTFLLHVCVYMCVFCAPVYICKYVSSIHAFWICACVYLGIWMCSFVHLNDTFTNHVSMHVCLCLQVYVLSSLESIYVCHYMQEISACSAAYVGNIWMFSTVCKETVQIVVSFMIHIYHQ
jgi:hypothetical protein